MWGPRRVKPNEHTYRLITRICREAGHLQEALHAYRGMRRCTHSHLQPFYFLTLRFWDMRVHDHATEQQLRKSAVSLSCHTAAVVCFKLACTPCQDVARFT